MELGRVGFKERDVSGPAHPLRRHRRRRASRVPRPGSAGPTPPAGGTATPTCCPAGSRPTSAGAGRVHDPHLRAAVRPRPAADPGATRAPSPSSARGPRPRSSAGSSCGCAARPCSPHPARRTLWAVVDEAALRRSPRGRGAAARPARPAHRAQPSCPTSPLQIAPLQLRRARRRGRPVHHPALPPSRTCPTSSTSSSSPARSTWTSASTSTTTRMVMDRLCAQVEPPDRTAAIATPSARRSEPAPIGPTRVPAAAAPRARRGPALHARRPALVDHARAPGRPARAPGRPGGRRRDAGRAPRSSGRRARSPRDAAYIAGLVPVVPPRAARSRCRSRSRSGSCTATSASWSSTSRTSWRRSRAAGTSSRRRWSGCAATSACPTSAPRTGSTASPRAC